VLPTAAGMEETMKQFVVNYLNFVNTLSNEYNNNAKALKADNREDEAVFFKVRENICDIFYKMANATEKKLAAMKAADEQAQIRKFNEEYLAWFDKIPENWKFNLEQAKKFNDAVTVKTEEVKLDTANTLKNKFLEIAGEAILQS
jgi:hypothetical protein